jgi:hypothetical protein
MKSVRTTPIYSDYLRMFPNISEIILPWDALFRVKQLKTQQIHNIRRCPTEIIKFEPAAFSANGLSRRPRLTRYVCCRSNPIISPANKAACEDSTFSGYQSMFLTVGKSGRRDLNPPLHIFRAATLDSSIEADRAAFPVQSPRLDANCFVSSISAHAILSLRVRSQHCRNSVRDGD